MSSMVQEVPLIAEILDRTNLEDIISFGEYFSRRNPTLITRTFLLVAFFPA